MGATSFLIVVYASFAELCTAIARERGAAEMEPRSEPAITARVPAMVRVCDLVGVIIIAVEIFGGCGTSNLQRCRGI